jgi:hypothetical protein
MSPHWASLIHEALAVIASFAYSQAPLEKLSRKRFPAECLFLEKVIYEIPRRAATQALIDFGRYFRALDNEQRLSDIWKQYSNPPVVGKLWIKDRQCELLSPHEMANKVMYAERIDWDLSSDPKIICVARDRERWLRAEIEVWLLLRLSGELGS